MHPMPIIPENTYAAIDLGSNSFHLLVATFNSGQLQQIDKVKQMVRLAASLDVNKNINKEGMSKALNCLSLFAQRIKGIPKDNVKVVGTNTLRIAKNANTFIHKAESILNHDIDIISGREEARMLYFGVAQSMSEHLTQKLVMDIGGGSTEVILGKGFKSLKRESLHMGCVSFTHRFFADQLITPEQWNKAHTQASQQLAPIIKKFKKKGWTHAIGSSGTMRATAKILIANQWSQTGISRNGLEQLKQHCFELGEIESLKSLLGLSVRREPVFIGGLVIIAALMDAFGLEHISVSNGALREGLVYSMGGGLHPDQVTERSIKRLKKQFDVDERQQFRVLKQANELIEHSDLTFAANDLFLLHSAIALHELGLSISHSQYQKHGAYIVQHADLPGFSRQQQLLISQLIYLHRRKITELSVSVLTQKQWLRIKPLLMVLRLAVIFSRNREKYDVPIEKLILGKEQHSLELDAEWLDAHPLIQADLIEEQQRWHQHNHIFKILT